MASSEVPAAGQVYFSDSEVQGSTGRSVGYGKDYGDSDLASTSAGSTDAEDLRQFQPIDILKSDCPEPCRCARFRESRYAHSTAMNCAF